MDLKRLLALARGDQPADLLLRNAQVVNVLSGEVHPADVALAEGVIVGVGTDYSAHETVDLDGRFLSPGFIDAHVHIESSMVTPREFARAVVPRGVTTVITDPHEIANVCGLAGIRFMLDDARDVPFTMLVVAMAPGFTSEFISGPPSAFWEFSKPKIWSRACRSCSSPRAA